jgi:hypothetical protein
MSKSRRASHSWIRATHAPTLRRRVCNLVSSNKTARTTTGNDMRIFLDDKLMCSLSCDIVMCDIIRHCARSTDMSTARRQAPTSRQGVLLHGRSPCRRRPLLRERIVCRHLFLPERIVYRHLLLRQTKGCPAFVSLTCILVQFCCETIIESRLTGVRL